MKEDEEDKSEVFLDSHLSFHHRHYCHYIWHLPLPSFPLKQDLTCLLMCSDVFQITNAVVLVPEDHPAKVPNARHVSRSVRADCRLGATEVHLASSQMGIQRQNRTSVWMYSKVGSQ